MEPAGRKYAKRHDGWYRAFERACKKALKTGDPNDGPTSGHLIGALMCSPDLGESGLSKNWREFMQRFPVVAMCVRRGAAVFRLAEDRPLRPVIPAGVTTAEKYLLTSNPDYISGQVLDAIDGNKHYIAKKTKPIVRQPQKVRGNKRREWGRRSRGGCRTTSTCTLAWILISILPST